MKTRGLRSQEVKVKPSAPPLLFGRMAQASASASNTLLPERGQDHVVNLLPQRQERRGHQLDRDIGLYQAATKAKDGELKSDPLD